MNKFQRVGAALAAGSLALAGTASAAGTTIDLSDVTATITSGIATITTLGISVLSLVVVVKLFKWVRGAM